MDLKLTLSSQKFSSIIPLNVSTWLKEIRRSAEPYEEVREWKPKTNLSSKLNVSDVSIYDNVNNEMDFDEDEDEDEDDNYEKINIWREATAPVPPERKESIGIRYSNEYQEIEFLENVYQEVRYPIERTLDTIIEESSHDYQDIDFSAKRKSVRDLKSSTWPLRKHPMIPDWRSTKDIRRYILTAKDMEMWFCLKDDNHRIINFNWSNSQLTMIKRVLNLNDVIFHSEGKDLAESRTQERVESNLFALMSNLLTSYREKLTQECVWSLLNEVHERNYECVKNEINEDLDEILNNIQNDISDIERSMAIIESRNEDNQIDLEDYFKNFEFEPTKIDYDIRKSLPPDFAPTSDYRYFNINNIFDNGIVKEKPPVPPRRKNKMEGDNRRLKPFAGRSRKLPKSLISKFEPPQMPPRPSENSIKKMQKLEEKTEKPLPFPVENCDLEYEMHELLMMKRVTESSKVRRKPPIERRVSLNYTIHEELPEESSQANGTKQPDENSSNGDISETKVETSQKENSDQSKLVTLEEAKEEMTDYCGQILNFLDSQAKKESAIIDEPNKSIRLREDVIIDWASNYENLNEPVVLEGKLLILPNFPKSVPELKQKIAEENFESGFEEGNECNEATEKVAPSNKQTSTSSVSDNDETITSYSDFESDINEAIAIGETWCNEWCSDAREAMANHCDDESSDWTSSSDEDTLKQKAFEVIPERVDHRLDTIIEDEEKTPVKRNSLLITVHLRKTDVVFSKSASEADLIDKMEQKPLRKDSLSKSMDFFKDSLTEERVPCCANLERSDSMRSDVVDWMARMRGVVYHEDQLFAQEEEEWFSSHDSEGRVYFFEENSNESSWALPDLALEGTRPEFNYGIQRSATESAISKTQESSAKLRHNKNGDKNVSRVSPAARSSKAHSMVIEHNLGFTSKDDNKTNSVPRDLSKFCGEGIREGKLNFTRVTENGKKLRKNWTQAYVLLNEYFLIFGKDAKTVHNLKNGANGNQMCLSLKGAVIEKGDKISSKKNTHKIRSVDNTEILIQTDKSAEAEDWSNAIRSVIEKLPQETIITSTTSSLDQNSPSKVGRTKSLKVKSKDTGSMEEDLNATPEERQNKIKARLKKFLRIRPPVDSLKKKGIYKDEPVFGCSLDQITKGRNPRVPVFVVKCIEFIESKEENMKADGLYRASGNLSQVQKIRLEVDQYNLNIMKDEEDVHVLTGSLKLFFRELKEPLIPFDQLETAIKATIKANGADNSRKDKIKEFQKIVKSLPGPNYDTLKFLLQHLLKVKEYREFNRMNIGNLAIVFGPTLMWPARTDYSKMALDLMQQNVVIECLLEEFHEIFT